MSKPTKIAELLRTFQSQEIKKHIRDLSVYYKTISQNLTDKTITDYTDFVEYIQNSSNILNVSKANINGLIFKSLNKNIIKDQTTTNVVVKQAVFEIKDQSIIDVLPISNHKLRELNSEKVAKQSNIRYSLQEMSRLRQEIVEINLQIKALSNIDYSEVIKKINVEVIKIINSNLFDHIYFNPDTVTLHCIQRNECVMCDNGDEFNLGKFSFNFNFKTNDFYVLPFTNNKITKYNNIHPFVFDHCGLCFGTGTAAMDECLETYDIAKIFMLADCIMHEYCDDNPITCLDSFQYPMTLDKYRSYFQWLEGNANSNNDEDEDTSENEEFYKKGSFYNHKLCDQMYNLTLINDENHLGFKLSDLNTASKVA